MKSDLLSASRACILDVLSRSKGPRMLLVDEEAMGALSLTVSQTELYNNEVFGVETFGAVERGDSGRSQDSHPIGAVCVCRPSSASYLFLCKELQSPRFEAYYIYFTNVVQHARLDQLAAADKMGLVKQIQEVFCDYSSVGWNEFSLELPDTVSLLAKRDLWGAYETASFKRMVEGMFGVCLSLLEFPVVRFLQASPLCSMVGASLQQLLETEHLLFEQFSQGGVGAFGNSLVLVYDRRHDASTPLLSQWTYESMCHELIGIRRGIVKIRADKSQGAVGDKGEYSLSCWQDEFFNKHRTTNFGDLGVAVKGYMSDFQKQCKTSADLQSVKEMQKFVDQFPEFKKLSSNVAKHVAIVHELSRQVDARKLLAVSAVEQELVCASYPQSQFNSVLSLVRGGTVSGLECLRLSVLYASVASRDLVGCDQLKGALRTSGVSEEQVRLVDLIREYSLVQTSEGGFSAMSAMSAAAKRVANIGGVENVYTQHKSKLYSIVESALKGKLSEQSFGYCPGYAGQQGLSRSSTSSSSAAFKPSTVIVFVVGGIVYEEVRDMEALNNAFGPTQRVIIGGSTVHNSQSFLAELAQMNRQPQQR